ncbi:MAG: hypothetical protein FJ109_04225 [Deltaproteobacteria bacterium]|nr:hypothetical protein [Deltaproteobacteria bacterium]
MGSERVALSVGRYKLIRRIAIGGMAEIFLGAMQGEAGFERKVIIKKILPVYASEPEFIRRLVDEGLLAARLQHGNIVQILDLGRLGPDYFIAMEFVDGVDLRDVLATCAERRFILPLPIAVHTLWQVSRGLGYAHDKKSNKGEPLDIVHRDISPANVFVSWEGAVKLGDFGIAKASQRLSRHTMTGVLQGKFPYMSPEQAEGKPLDQRSDVFSFGIVAYELLSGRRPFSGDSDMQVLVRVKETRFAPLLDIRPALPPELARIVHCCLEREPERRYPNGTGLERALAQLMQQQHWIVTEGDVADTLNMLYGSRRRSVAEASVDEEERAQVLDASPLDPYDLQAGLPSAPLRLRREPQPDRTRSVVVTPTPLPKRRSAAIALLAAGLALGGLAAADYFGFHWLLGRNPTAEETMAVEAAAADQAEAEQAVPPAAGKPAADVRASTDAAAAGRLDVVAGPPGADAASAVTDAATSAHAGGGGEALDGKNMGPVEPTEPPGRVEDMGRPPLEPPPEPVPDSLSEQPATDLSERPAPPPDRSLTRLTVVPHDALVYVDGKLEGNPPQRIASVAGEKPRHVRIERDGYVTQEFDLSHPAPRILGKQLQRLSTGVFRLRYFPASAEVLVDDILRKPEQGLNIIELKLSVGPHKLVVRAGDKSTERDFTIQEDKEWTETITAGQ